MADISWGHYQKQHIEVCHGVSAREFDEAWHRREDEAFEREHPQYGECYRSVGFTDAERMIEMVWRWQHQDPGLDLVWPITAYEPKDVED